MDDDEYTGPPTTVVARFSRLPEDEMKALRARAERAEAKVGRLLRDNARMRMTLGVIADAWKGSLLNAREIARAALADEQSAPTQRRKCEECGKNYADHPSRLCPGCEAYQEHQADKR
jgi:hypothetical protein